MNGQTTYYDWQTIGSAVRLAQITNAFGRALQLTYDAAGRLEHLIDPSGAITEYSYDTQNRLIRVTFADLHFKQYLYEDALLPNHLTGIIDENGDRYATYAYDSSGRTILSEHAGHAQKATFSYPSASNTVVRYHQSATSYRDKLYVIDQAHGTDRLLRDEDYACNDCTTGTIINEYDSNGWLKKSTNRNGIVTTYTLDSSGRETSRTEAYGTSIARTISTSWDTTWNKPWRIEQGQHRRQHTYTATGLLATLVELDTALGTSRTTTYTCNAQGLLSSLDGPRTDAPDVTTYTYDSEGNLATITSALGHLTQITAYDDNGRPLAMIDPNGVTTTLAYAARGWLKSRTVGGELTNFEYDAAGQLIRVTFPDGSDIEYEYDAAHRLIRIESAANERIEYTLDYAGNRIQEQVFDAANNLMQTRSSVFNALNQLLRELNAMNGIVASYEYDANGNATDAHAALGRDTSNVYDALDRLLQVVDPLSGVSQYGYNALDQLTSVTDPRGKVTNYTYNALGDMTQQVSPDSGTTTHTYDSGGNLKTRTDARSKTATYSYDALNRVTGVTYPDQTISYTYDTGSHQKGRLTQVSDGSGSTHWTYDTHGRVLTHQQVVGAVTQSLGYAYDASGRLQTLTLPSGNTVTYGYTNGKVTSLTLNGSTTLLSNVLYQPFGPTSGWTWGNLTLAVREYDTDGKVTDIDSAGLKTYSYDTAFRITGVTDATNPNLSQSYGYDLLDRLTSATGTGLNQSWTYDANGNRLTQGGSQSSTYAVSSTSNRLNSTTGVLTRTYSYDAAGNTTGDGTVTFTYNDAGRMVSATKAGITATYAINALGQRVKKTTSGASTYFVYDEAGHLVGEYDNSANLIQETLWFGDTPVATLKPNGAGVNIFYVHTDHLNTPRKISRPSDNVVVWRWDSDPFGMSTANEDPDGDSNLFAYNLRFPGQYIDAETGLHYNYHRDAYDPEIGRYTQSDPIGLLGGINTYAYAGENPISFADPLGLKPGDIFDSRAAAEQDRALYVPLVHEHNYTIDLCWLVGCSNRGWLFLGDVYEVGSCKYTYNLTGANVGFPPGIGKKPGKLGVFKGRDALRRENNIARDAAKQAGLTNDQARQLHDEISGQGLSFHEILQRALDIAGKK